MARIRGTNSSEVLRGTNAGDLILAFGGNDLLIGYNGNDLLRGYAGNDRIVGGNGNDRLYGDSGYDRLEGGAGHDILIGGLNVDRMYGGTGNDRYYWSTGDIIVERANQGIDTVIVNELESRNFRLAANVENLLIKSSDYANITIIGNNSNNKITVKDGVAKIYGYGGNDILVGTNGVDHADIIDGGTGRDTMYGLSDDDIYYVDNVGDVVVESNVKGNDTIRSTVSYTLPDNVERLELIGSGNINGTGTDAYGEQIVGNSGNNIIDGGIGGDYLWGKAGADRFYYDEIDDSTFDNTKGADFVWDFAAGEGDKLDLSAFDWNKGNAFDDAFTYIGSAAFSGPGQVRATTYHDATSGTDGILVEVNFAYSGSTAEAEMEIRLVDAVNPDSSWFIL